MSDIPNRYSEFAAAVPNRFGDMQAGQSVSTVERDSGGILDTIVKGLSIAGQETFEGIRDIVVKPVVERGQEALQMLQHTGHTGRGMAVDLIRGNLLPSTMTNTASAIQGGEIDEQGLTPVQKGLAGIVEALPGLAAVLGVSAAGVPAPAAFSGFLGADALARGASPQDAGLAAATGMVLPIAAGAAGRGMGGVLQEAAQSGGGLAARPVVQKLAESLASQAGAGAVIEGGNIPAYAEMEPQQRKDALIESMVGNAAFLPMEAPRFMRGVPSETQRLIAEDQPRTVLDPNTEALNLNDPKNAQQRYESPIGRTDNQAAPDSGRVSVSSSGGVGEAPTPAVPARGQFYRDTDVLLGGKDFGFKPGARVDGQQLRNRLKNKVTPGEFMALEESGLGEFLKEKRTPEEVAEWVEENGPRVEVRELRAKPGTRKAIERRSQISHELGTKGFYWFAGGDGGLTLKDRRNDNPVLKVDMDRETVTWKGPNVPNDVLKLVEESASLVDQARDEVKNKRNESATARYTKVNPKPLDKMPGAVDLLVRVPINEKRRDARLKARAEQFAGAPPEVLRANPETKTEVKYSSSHYPTEGKNVVGFGRAYIETLPSDTQMPDGTILPKGSKVLHGFEIQRDVKPEETYEGSGIWKIKGWHGGSPEFKSRNEAEAWLVKQEPLFRDYNRLVVKALIDHARKNGADAIALSDAQTAMLTEGHDKTVTTGWRAVNNHGASFPALEGFKTQAEAQAALDAFLKRDPNRRDTWKLEEVTGPTQGKGMRLNYDQTLPKIAEELTGEKGVEVDFGEHQNAFDTATESSRQMMEEGEFREGKQPRPDLIFRNPDGTPKTSITARLYPLKNARKEFSLFGSDKAERPKPVELVKDVPVKVEPRGMKVREAIRDKGEEGFARFPVNLRPKTTSPLPSDWLPDLGSKVDANREFSQKFAADKIPILGRALGGRARISTPVDESIAAWYAERHGVGPAHASAIGTKMGGEVNDVFKADEKGDLNVKPTKEGQSLKIADVFEALQDNPTAYDLTPEQRRVFDNLLKPIVGRMGELVKQHDLVDVEGPYFMRGHAKGPDQESAKRPGNRVGTKQGFQKERVFGTEAEGWERGFTYNTDVEARIVQGVQSMYRAIADSRLAKDKVLGGRTRAQLMSDLRAVYPDMSKDQLRKIANSVQSKGSVYSPAFFGRIFKPEVAKVLNREFAAEQSSLRKMIADGNSFLKALKLGFDFGAGQIQLLPTLYNRPDIWAKSQAVAAGSFASKDVWTAYARNHEQSIKELAKFGSSVGRLEEYMAGGGALVKAMKKTPVVGEAAAAMTESFNRHFQTSLDVAKIELWEAWRDVTPKEEWGKVIQSIESTLLSGRMESGMVTHNRALTERVLLLAPSYYRGAINFVGALAESGVSGKVARRAMGKFVAGSVATFYGVGMALGMDKEELDQRLDPRRVDFMMWDVDDAGKKMHVGFGGIFRSFLRLGGNVVKTSTEHPGNWKSLSSEKNPITRWYRGHAGPLPGAVWSGFSGKDFLGSESTIGGGIADTLPLALDSGTKKETALRVTGFSTIPARPVTAAELAKKLTGKTMDELPLKERRKFEKQADDLASDKTPDEQKRAAHRALDYTFERQQRLEKALSPTSRDFLKQHSIRVPGYQEGETIAGVKISFTEKEEGIYFKELVTQYEAVVKKLQRVKLEAFTKDQKERRAEALFGAAKTRALAAVRKARRSSSTVE